MAVPSGAAYSHLERSRKVMGDVLDYRREPSSRNQRRFRLTEPVILWILWYASNPARPTGSAGTLRSGEQLPGLPGLAKEQVTDVSTASLAVGFF